MSQSFGVEYWSRQSRRYRQGNARLRFIARVLSKLPQRRLLDIGCSSGVLGELLPRDFCYFGCDIISEAAGRLPAGHFLQSDFNQTQDLSYFADKGIDVVHLGALLEYLRRPERILEEARRLAPAGSPLVVGIVNFEGESYAQPSSHHPGWIYKPTLDAFLAMLASTGWRHERGWAFSNKRGEAGAWFRLWSRVRGWDHPWTRRHARQFIVLARAEA